MSETASAWCGKITGDRLSPTSLWFHKVEKATMSTLRLCPHYWNRSPLHWPLQTHNTGYTGLSVFGHASPPNRFRHVFWKTRSIYSVVPQLSKEWRTDFFPGSLNCIRTLPRKCKKKLLCPQPTSQDHLASATVQWIRSPVQFCWASVTTSPLKKKKKKGRWWTYAKVQRKF